MYKRGGYMKSVLIADDAAFMRLSLKKLLCNSGFNVVGEAENGKVAVKKYKELNPDIVTMDITMPEMTGIEALKLIMDYDSKAKVIMITALGQEEFVRQAIMEGARSFIVKPYKEEKVIQVLKQYL
jgi:two-component system chemotaxis response regulator CheY